MTQANPNPQPPPEPDYEVPGLTFLVARTLQGDPAAAYQADFIKSVAASTPTEIRDITARLAAKFGKDFSSRRFSADVKDARAALLQAGPAVNLILSETGVPKPNLANAITALAGHLSVGWDEFAQTITILKPSPWDTRGEWRDIDDIQAANWLQHKGVNVGPDTAAHAIQAIAHENPFHPVRDYLNGLQWDGESRLTHWLHDCLGAPNSAYTQQVGKFWMLSAVARAMNPGCKVDTMLVLEGTQGKLKSQALRVLTNGHGEGLGGVQWFTDALPEIDHQDIGPSMQGVWIVEFGELDSIRGREWTATKKFISKQTERYRRSYGRNVQSYPRQCVFAGSTNEDKWMNDTTGGRRFWAVPVGTVSIPAILRLRDQLWAEATARIQAGELWYGDAEFEAIARAEISERSEDDPWEPIVLRWLDDTMAADISPVADFKISSQEILTKALKIRESDLNKGQTAKLGQIMTRNGWAQRELRWKGIKGRWWVRG